MKFLTTQANLSDLISWAFAAPVIMSTPLLFRVPFVLERFENECQSLNAKLTKVTVLFLNIPPAAWIIAPTIVNIILIACLLICKRPALKICIVLIGGFVIGILQWLMVWGMIFPSFQNINGPLS